MTGNSPRFAELSARCRAEPPRTALVLGSGMGVVARRVRNAVSVPFAEVPGLPQTSVAGHAGRLTLCDWAGQRVLLFEGRLHHYEGHPWEVVVRPIQAAAELGVRHVVLTNAAGGIGEALYPGSLMALRDQLDCTRPYFWRCPRSSPYSPRLLQLLSRAAAGQGIELAQGVYAAVTGPCYETPAEIRVLRAWGADAVGMSTAREAAAGAAADLECAAVSCITNRAAGLTSEPLNHEEVLATAAAQGDRLTALLEAFLTLLAAG